MAVAGEFTPLPPEAVKKPKVFSQPLFYAYARKGIRQTSGLGKYVEKVGRSHKSAPRALHAAKVGRHFVIPTQSEKVRNKPLRGGVYLLTESND